MGVMRRIVERERERERETFSSSDGLFTLSYLPTWFAEARPAPSAGTSAYISGYLSSIDPTVPHPTFPPEAAKIDIQVSLPGVYPCPNPPEGAANAVLGGAAGWRTASDEPNELGQTFVAVGSFVNGRCFTITGYFGPDNHDQGTFDRIVATFAYTSSDP
jgi:hypothetical protein